jgi:hypothetical protein
MNDQQSKSLWGRSTLRPCCLHQFLFEYLWSVLINHWYLSHHLRLTQHPRHIFMDHHRPSSPRHSDSGIFVFTHLCGPNVPNGCENLCIGSLAWTFENFGLILMLVVDTDHRYRAEFIGWRNVLVKCMLFDSLHLNKGGLRVAWTGRPWNWCAQFSTGTYSCSPKIYWTRVGWMASSKQFKMPMCHFRLRRIFETAWSSIDSGAWSWEQIRTPLSIAWLMGN